MIRLGGRRRTRSTALAPASLLASLPALASPASADPFLPSAAQAVRLVRDNRTDGHVTVGQTLAYAARVRPRLFQALDRELGLRQDPSARALRDIFAPFDPYDRR